MDKAPRKPKQLYRKDAQIKSEQYMNYDLFQNEEQTSFLSQSFCSSVSQRDKDGEKIFKPCISNSILDITTDDIQVEQSRTNIKFLPIIYLLSSGITMFGGIINQFQQRKQKIDTLLPQFLELPFRQLHIFQIGIALTSVTGVINHILTYLMWRQSKQHYNDAQLINCLIGIFSQLSIFVFSILPSAMPTNLDIRSEDCMFLNLYFVASFLYQCIYMYCMVRTVPKMIKIAYSYQIRIAFFVICVIVFVFYGFTGIAGQGHYLRIDQLAIQNANSICAFILFALNTVFISLFYFDLKTVNLILKFAHIQDVKKIRKYNQSIL
ncbi:transmembrane protein, putative (macronuclear) [Tetrahymena thermophila SB210]|uniref:Transmembrane protein, putative n=1 Tax=Tetrahymena thermophila (strain SB210) TaxID=312017 RepID=Q24BV3_TETTS|nr:transmembrane protein, putative [Tetrahymena thermophila SB210]EAS05284.2 transmembrane protein, putative [Tetrahymena thermophila SB210]|eukprot:XP_001025529.2 transmembrane protein, putative [Tetrahymena thermophila SB210]